MRLAKPSRTNPVPSIFTIAFLIFALSLVPLHGQSASHPTGLTGASRTSAADVNNTLRLLLRYQANARSAVQPGFGKAPFHVAQNFSLVRPQQPRITTDNWLGGAGNWSNGALWSAGVPSSTTNAVITAASSTVALDISGTTNNLTVGTGNSLNFNNNENLTVDGTSIVNSNKTGTGGITLNSVGNNTELIIGSANVSLSGGGTVTLGNNANNLIFGSAAANILTNVDNTIQGSGNIGDRQMALVNQGTIDANQSVALTIQTSNGTTNSGTLEATNGANLILQGDTYTNTGGTVKAVGTNSLVSINGSTINGGTLTTSTGGIIDANGGTTLNGVTNSGTLQLPNNSTVVVQGTLTNSSTIGLLSVGNTTALELSGNVMLTGGGTITLSNNTNNYIYGAVGTDILTNVNNTISGSGQIGDNQMGLVNQSVIDANQSSTLTIHTTNGTTNTGTLEATNGATLILQGDTYTNTGGTIQAVGAGSLVNLTGNTVNGGTLTDSGGGIIQSLGAAVSGVTNSGTLQLPNNNNLTLNGNLTNSGTVSLLSGGNNTELIVNAASISLTGGGTVTLSNNTNNYIFGSAGTDVLTNVNNTISGSGNIGDNQMGLVNQATINANQSSPLTIETNSGTTNTGTLEATAGATLNLDGYTFTNTGGMIKAVGTGSLVSITNATINGGTVSASSGGLIQSMGSATTFNGLTTSGTVAIPNNNDLTLAGTITNTGAIQVNSSGNNTFLESSGAVTLTGGGTVALTDNNNNYLLASSGGSSLTNVNNTISGSGNIGNNGMAFTNDAAGIVNATSALGNVLTIQPGTAGATNLGLMEASSGGELQLENVITNTNGTTKGTIEALNGGTVLLNGASIGGGTLTTAGTGIVLLENAAQLDGSTNTITTSGSLQIPNNNAAYLKGTINNTGTLTVNSTANNTFLYINSPTVTLQGSGMINLSDNNDNIILAATGGNLLINQQTIQGPGGDIGNASLNITNQGTIDATASAHGNVLTIQPGPGGLTNTSLIEATGGGALALDGGTFTNTGGTITAGSGSSVTLEGSVTVIGGTLNGAGTFTSLTNSTLNGLTNAGTLLVPNNNETTLVGTITNTGSLQLNSSGNQTFLFPSGAVTLTGGGTLTLTDNNNNFLAAAVTGSSLTNVNNTISGSGNIGTGDLIFTNQAAGIVDATSSHGNSLTINPGAGGATNQGTFEASSGGSLVIDNTLNNTGGTITALAGTGTAAGGSVVINGATVTGGTLNTLGTGVNAGSMTIQSGAILNSVTNLGTIGLPNNTTAELEGSIINNGSIQVNSVGNNTFLFIDGNTTLNGTGTIVLSNNPNNYVYGVAGTEVLTTSNTIEGAGNLGNGLLGIVNNGTILANDPTELVVRTNASGFTNNGTVAVNAGSTLDITGGPFSNFNSGTSTLTGGTYNVGGTLQFDNANIVTNAASITLTGTSAQIISNTNANALANFATNAAGGSFNIQGGANFTTAGNFTNDGILIVGNTDTFKVTGNLSNFASSTLTAGTYDVAGTLEFGPSGSSLTTNDANLTLIGPSAKLLNLGGTSLLTGFATNASGANFNVVGGGNFATASNFTNAGTMDLEQGSVLTVTGNLTNTGTVTTNGSDLAGSANNLTVTGTLTNSGTGQVTIGVNGNTADVANVGLLANSAPITVDAGATLNLTTSGTDTNTSTVTLNGGKLELSGTTTLSGTHGIVDLVGGTITGARPTVSFTNSETIEGSGTISNLKMVNNTSGVLLANAAAPLIILPATGGLNNKGTITVNTGSTMEIGTSAGGSLLNFSANTLTGGTYNISGTLQFGASGTSLVTNAANITLTGSGSQIIDFGNNNILAGFATNNAGANFTLGAGRSFTTGGNFTNNGTLTVGTGDTFDVNGNLTNFASGTLTGGTYKLTGILEFANAAITTNAAAITLTGTGAAIENQTGTNALLGFNNNAATGSFTLASAAAFTTSVTSFTNAGVFDIMRGTSFKGGSAFNFTQTGGTSTIDGMLTSSSLGTVTLDAGSLFGVGTVNEKVVDSATITPGDSATSTGTLSVKNTYTQTSTGALDIAIDGTTTGKFDVLNITKTATLNGTLNISLVSGFVPTVGSTFDILNASSVTGAFATINGTSINSSEHFTVTVNGNDVVLTVVAGPGPASAPADFSNTLRRHSSHLAAVPTSVLFGAARGYGLGASHFAAGSAPVERHLPPSIVTPIAAAASAATGHLHGVRALDDSVSAPAVAAPFSAGSSAPSFAGVSSTPASAFNNMARMDHMRFEIGVDAKTAFRTSPKKLLKAFIADPDSKDALSIGYITFTSSH